MRTLNRPMFRTGGSAGTGITSGLAPRQGYDNGKLVQDAREREKLISSMVKQRPDNSLNQFLIDFGLNLVSGTPRSNIFATAAEQAKDPLARMQQTKAQKTALDQQISMAAATGAISQRDKMAQLALKGPTGMLDAQKKAQIMWSNRRTDTNPTGSFNTTTGEDWESYSEVEAFVTEQSIYSKSGMYTPKVEKDIDIGTRTEFLMDDNLPDAYSNPTQAAEIAEIGYNVSTDPMYDEIKNKFDYNIYVINPDEFGSKLNVEGSTAYQKANVGVEGSDYIHNKVYYNYEDGQFYTYNSAGVGSFHLVTLDMEQ